MHYCKALRYEDRPDYNYLRKLYSDIMARENYVYDYIFDWTLTAPIGPTKSSNVNNGAGSKDAQKSSGPQRKNGSEKSLGDSGNKKNDKVEITSPELMRKEAGKKSEGKEEETKKEEKNLNDGTDSKVSDEDESKSDSQPKETEKKEEKVVEEKKEENSMTLKELMANTKGRTKRKQKTANRKHKSKNKEKNEGELRSKGIYNFILNTAMIIIHYSKIKVHNIRNI